MPRPALIGVASILVGVLHAQTTLRPGTDVALRALGDVLSPGSGRVGSFPDGEQAIAISTTCCNTGTVDVPWRADMDFDHPVIAPGVIYREHNGRFEQISVLRGVRHVANAANAPGCGNCPGGAGTALVTGCMDTSTASENYDHYWLGPIGEVDPWLGSWTPRGSHFDRGFPAVAPPQDTDNVRSLTRSGAVSMGPIGYRASVFDADLAVTGATYWSSAQYVVYGEPEANRDNNMACRRLTPSWGGAEWTLANADAQQFTGPALVRWAGAMVTSGTNFDDGRFYVGVKVTGPVNGIYRYDYAVFNRDNRRQGAVVRIPICNAVTFGNPYFHDADHDANNDWRATRNPSEIVFQSPITNRLTWGNMFNFGFDSDAAPASARVVIDQALPGSGPSNVSIASIGPVDVRNVLVCAAQFPPACGCGTPAVPSFTARSEARLGNASFALTTSNVAPGSINICFFSTNGASGYVGGDCHFLFGPNFLFLSLVAAADGAGIATHGLPIPNDPALNTLAVYAQTWEYQPGTGAYLRTWDMSNGRRIKLGSGNVGCN